MQFRGGDGVINISESRECTYEEYSQYHSGMPHARYGTPPCPLESGTMDKLSGWVRNFVKNPVRLKLSPQDVTSPCLTEVARRHFPAGLRDTTLAPCWVGRVTWLVGPLGGRKGPKGMLPIHVYVSDHSARPCLFVGPPSSPLLPSHPKGGVRPTLPPCSPHGPLFFRWNFFQGKGAEGS